MNFEDKVSETLPLPMPMPMPMPMQRPTNRLSKILKEHKGRRPRWLKT
jgi:hypothetical protein